MSVSSRGKAIFSTRLGRFLPREAVEPRGPIVLRSEPEDDLDNKIASLERDFPLQSKAITLPIMNIYEYFDHYDCHVLGTGFLHKVLENIVFRNFTRSQYVQEIVNGWKEGKLASLDTTAVAQSLHDIFTETEIEEYGEDILREAFAKIGDPRRLGLDREATNSQHRRESLHRDTQNTISFQASPPDPSMHPQRNSSAPQSSRISYVAPQIHHLPVQRSNSALDMPSNEIPKEASGISPSQEQIVIGRKDHYSDPTDNTLQVPMQVFPSDTAPYPPQSLPVPISYYPTPLGVRIPQDTFQAATPQPQPIVQTPMAKKPRPMGFSNDARNLMKLPTGATTVPVPPAQQVMHMPYHFHSPGAENHYPRDMGGSNPGFDSDHTKQPFSGYPAASPFNGENHLDQARFLANDHPAAVHFGLRNGGRGQYRRSSSNQSQSAFRPPSAASSLKIVPSILPPVLEPYRHFSTGHLSNQTTWSQDGDLSTPTNVASAAGFSERQRPRQNGPQRNIHRAHRLSERCDEKTIYVGWFPDHVDSEMLRRFFAHCGPILYISSPRPSYSASTPNCNYYSFIKYANATDATQAIKVFHKKPLDFLGGPRDLMLRVQPPTGTWEDRYNREGVRTQAFSKPGGSPYKQHHRNESRLYRGDNSRRDSLPSQYAETPGAYADVDHGDLTGSATLDSRPNLDGMVTTQLTEERMEVSPQLSPTMSQYDISQRKVAVKLPPTGKDERGRQGVTELKIDVQDNSVVANVLSATEQQDSRQEQASQERSGNTRSGVVLDKADKNSESLTKSRAENKPTAPRSAKEEEPKLALGKTNTARVMSALAMVEKRPEKSAEEQTGEKEPTTAQPQKAAESYPRPKPEARSSAQTPLGKKLERSNKQKAGEKIEQFEDSAKPSTTKTSIVDTSAVTTLLHPSLGQDNSAHVISKDTEAYSIKDGSMTLAAFPVSMGARPKHEAATAKPQDQAVSSPMSRVDSSSTKDSELGGPSPFTSTEPTTYAHSEHSESGALESQVTISTSTAKSIPLKPSYDSTRPDVRSIQKAAISGSCKLESLATDAEKFECMEENKKASVPPTPSTGAVNPPDPILANPPLLLSTKNLKGHSPGNSDPKTIKSEQQSLGTSVGGSKPTIDAPLSAPTGKIEDRALVTQANASLTASDKIASLEIDNPSKVPDSQQGPPMPPRSSSFVTPATPILTHMKKQRNLKSPKIATDNPYAGLIPRTLDTPLGEMSFSVGKEIPHSNLADSGGKGSGYIGLLERDRLGKFDNLRAQKRSDEASVSADTLLQPMESAQDRQISQKPKTEQVESYALESNTPIPSNDFRKTEKKTLTKTKKKSKSKGSKDSTVSEPAAEEPISLASASSARTTLPEPETPFLRDDFGPLPSPMNNYKSNDEDSSSLPEEKIFRLNRFSVGMEEYYRKKTEDYDPKLRQAMLYHDVTTNTAPLGFPNDTFPPKRAEVDDTDLDVVDTARRLGYLGQWGAVMDTPVGSGPRIVSLHDALNAFESHGQRKTSDSEDSPSTLGASNESNVGQLQKARKESQGVEGESFTSNDPFHKQMAEVDIAMQKKRKPRELAFPSLSKAGSGNYPDQKEILSQLTPETKKVFLNLQSSPTTALVVPSSVPVTPTRLEQSAAQVLSPQQVPILEQLNTPEGHQTAAPHVLEHGQHLGSIANKVKTLSPQERRELAMLEAQFAGTSLPLKEVNESLTESPSKEDLRKIANEMSKLTESSRGIVISLIAQSVSPPASPLKQHSPTSSQQRPLPSAANVPPPPPPSAHKKLPSYSEVATSPPKRSARLQSPPRRSAQLPSLQPGDTVEVTQLGTDALTSGMTREGPLQRPFRAGSEGPHREGLGMKGTGRRRTQEGPERPFTERRDREGWSMAAHQLAHNNDVDPWGVPRGEKAWGTGSGR